MSTYLAIVLKNARGRKGLTQDQAGQAIHVSGSLIGMFETGRRIPHPETATQLDQLFETGDLIAQVATEARKGAQPEWFRPWPDVEAEATSLRWHEPLVISGLLQTEDYARAILSCGLLSEAEVEAGVTARLERQAAVFDRERPPLTTFVIGEAALLHGEPEMMRAQLAHLLKMGERPHVLIHVVPMSVGLHVGLAGPFVIASVASGPDVTYLDDQLKGRIITGQEEVATLVRTWELLRAVALPCNQSAELIAKVAERWT